MRRLARAVRTRGVATPSVGGRASAFASAFARAFGCASACALLMMIPGAAHAQTTATGPITLERALEIASRSNPEYRKALNNRDLVGPQARQTWGAFLPDLSLSLGTGYSFVENRVGTDDFGNPIVNPNAERRWNSSANQGLNASITLFEGGSRFHDVGAARAQADSREWSTRAELTRVTADVSREFYSALRLGELLELERELLAGTEQDLEATRRQFEIATKSQAELLGAQLEVRTQERVIRQAESDRLKSLEALRVALGDRALDLSAGVSGTGPVLDNLDWLDVEELVALSLGENPTLRAQMADQRVAAASLGSARARRWPTISLGTQIGRSGFGPEKDFLFDASPDQRRGGGFSLNVSVPLFSRFQTSYQIAQADVALRNAQQDVLSGQLQTEQRIRDAVIDLRLAYDLVALRGEERALAERRLELVRDEYRLAIADFERLQIAVREAANARRAELNARYDLIDRLIGLEEAVGTPVMPGAGN